MICALDLIAASAIPLRDAVTCVNPRNINELDSISRMLLLHRMPAWRLFRIFPAGRARDNSELLLSKDDTALMIRWIRDNRTSLRHSGIAVQLSCEGWLPFSVDRQVRDQPFFCRAGINIASILNDGTITGCSNNDARFYQGNVLEEPLEQIWRTKFGTMRDRTWVGGTSCGSCSHVRECEGGSLHLWRNNADKPDFCYADCF
jgi:radical SAM protein with 4Fe4S-binding SPASM domain